MLIALLCQFAVFPGYAGSSPTDIRATKEKSASQSAYDRFLALTEALYDAVNRGSPTEALKWMRETERQFRAMPMNGIPTAEGVQALAQSITEMKRTVAALQPDEQKWKSGAASLRLAADALAHPSKPIWHQYRSIFTEDIKKLKHSIVDVPTGATEVPLNARHSFDALIAHYSIVRTAAAITATPAQIEHSDSVTRYATRVLQAKPANIKLLRGAILPLEEALGRLFPAVDGEAALVPPFPAGPSWGWSAMMGSFIVTVLTWAGWQRYKVERDAAPFGTSSREQPKDAADRFIGRRKHK